MEPLLDGHGRLIGDLRVSVTDRCNFRCQYCMPAEGLPWLERTGVLTYEEITRLVAVLAHMGVREVRLTDRTEVRFGKDHLDLGGGHAAVAVGDREQPEAVAACRRGCSERFR